MMFYDLRIHRYLESGVNSARTVTLRTSRGYIVSIDSTIHRFVSHNTFIRLFSPLRTLKKNT